MTNSIEIFDFQSTADIKNWYVVDDVVMGGRSTGSFMLNSEGHGEFRGKVSLENDGGFSSVRYRFESLQVSDYEIVKIRLKGDGKSYQFRVKSSADERYSYIAHFDTNGDWQTIEIPFEGMYPSFRGNKLDLPNYPGETMVEMAFLISNKKAETFTLLLDRIDLK